MSEEGKGLIESRGLLKNVKFKRVALIDHVYHRNIYVYLQRDMISGSDGKCVLLGCLFVLYFFIKKKSFFVLNQLGSCSVLSLLLNNMKGNVPGGI